jgi:Arrestin (or S-antigen), N-terminal domain
MVVCAVFGYREPILPNSLHPFHFLGRTASSGRLLAFLGSVFINRSLPCTADHLFRKMAVNPMIQAVAGEMAWAMASNLISMADGSTILVQTDKPSYNAGEMMTGRVIAYICHPVVCDEVAVKVRLKAKVEWDAEIAHTHYEGEGENRKAITTYTHEEKTNKKTIFKDKITVSRVDHMLPPGTYSYPFSYQIPPQVPGVSKFKRKERARDPEWQKENREIEYKSQLVFTVKACLQTAGAFSRELKSRQELTVNPFFDVSTTTCLTPPCLI